MHNDVIDPHGRARWTRRLLARGVALLAATLLISALAGSSSAARAADPPSPSLGMVADEVRAINQRLESTREELAVARAVAAGERGQRLPGHRAGREELQHLDQALLAARLHVELRQQRCHRLRDAYLGLRDALEVGRPVHLAALHLRVVE